MKRVIRVKTHLRKGKLVRSHLRTWKVKVLSSNAAFPGYFTKKIELGPESDVNDAIQAYNRRYPFLDDEIVSVESE